ncbi:WD40 repeat domain-containing protein [Urbifossiella limnaea]|uniref:WD domain, G-beta repeat n=1 Tax=Urbifossiella limnaea TaxID=2528023 RepID=A0A517XRW8_9BACT|nr:WD40 repeat domain-containing protein [Urbifossiella limnaea]QDU20257.1 WD domain, G-beta repeat [Urbifossiella limnaea]
MPHARTRALALAVIAGALVTAARAQPDPEPAALAERFAAERAAADKAGFPAGRLAPADDLAAKAAAALKAGNGRGAARYYRDARWQLPFLPAGLPPHVTRVLGESRVRHADHVNSLAYRRDGAVLASASKDGTVRLWDLGNGRELLTYRGHADADAPRGADVFKVAGVDFAPDGKTVASVGGKELHLWDAATGKVVKTLAVVEKDDRPLRAVAYAPDGKAVAVGGDDGVVRVYDPASGKETFKSGPRNARIERVAFSPNGKLIGAADSTGNVGVYAPGLPNPMPMSVPAVERGGPCLGVAFAADGRAVFTCGADNKARLTSGPKADGTPDPDILKDLKQYVGHTDAVTDLALTADGKTLVTGSGDGTVRVWETDTAKQVRLFQGHVVEQVSKSGVTAVAVRLDGKQAASAGHDGSIRLWDLNAADENRPLAGAAGPVWAVALTADGKLAAAAGADKTVRLYDPETGAAAGELTGHAAAVTALAFLADGKLASAGGDRVVKLWDTATRAVVKELPGHELPVLALATDGKLLVSAAADRTARGWDAAAGKGLWTWTGKAAACAAAVRPGGKQVAVGTADGNLAVLDVTGGEPKEVWSGSAHTAGVAAAAYAPAGAALATVGGDGVMQLWELDEAGRPSPGHRFEGTPRADKGGFAPLSAVAFTPDGRFVASAGADAVVRVFDTRTKAEVRGLRGHAEWTTALAFGPGGRLLVSGGADKKVLAFELTPQEGATPVGHMLKINAVAVSPDGKTAATGSDDRTVKLWDVATGRELDTLAGPTDRPQALAFLGADRLAVGSLALSGGSGQLHFWKGRPAKLVSSVTPGEVYALAALPDGSKLAAWTARAVQGEVVKASAYEVYDAGGKSLTVVRDAGRDVRAVAFAADLSLAVAGDATGTIRLWDLATQKQAGGDWPLFAEPLADLGLTADKAKLVAADAAGHVKVADVAKRAVVATAAADAKGVRALVVSPAGDSFVTIGRDGGEVKAWPLAAAGELKPSRVWALPVGVLAAAYTPDGRSLVTANADGTAYVLALP